MTRGTKKRRDWHPADIKAALEKKGSSLAEVERKNGYSVGAASQVWSRNYPAMQAAIGRELGVPPQRIWPSRYNGLRPRTGRVARKAA